MEKMIDFLTDLHTSLIDPERIPFAVAAILIAMVLGAITGPVLGNANPLLWLAIDKVFGGIGERLDRANRPRGDLIFRGFMMTAIVITFFFLIAKTFFFPMRWLLILMLCISITAGTIWFALLRLYFAMEKQEVGKGAYYAISRTMRLNLSGSDDFGITRAGMALAARSFDKGLIAPVFWYLLLGLPGIFVYNAVAALAWRFGKDGATTGFGSVPLALEKLMGFAPSFLSGTLILFASLPSPTASPIKSLRFLMDSKKGRATYEEGGFALSALAWTLNVTLGGPREDIDGAKIKGGWVGPSGATAQLTHAHLRRALIINATAHILFIATLCGAYIWGTQVFS